MVVVELVAPETEIVNVEIDVVVGPLSIGKSKCFSRKQFLQRGVEP